MSDDDNGPTIPELVCLMVVTMVFVWGGLTLVWP